MGCLYPIYISTGSVLKVCWEINGDQFKLRAVQQCSLYQFNESNSEIDGRANDTTLFKSVILGSIWNVNSFLIQFLFMWWYINFTDNTILDFMFTFSSLEQRRKEILSYFVHPIFSFLLSSNCIVALMRIFALRMYTLHLAWREF